jgi:predicted Zn-dependent protease
MERAAGAGAPPEMLSTHPSSASRIRELEARISSAMPIYEKARAAGIRPNCG